MFNVRDIVRNNLATFYDFNTRKRRSQVPRAIVTCVIASLFAILCPRVSDNLLAGFLAVQSILLGFTFNVMFFLLGNRENQTKDHQSLEEDLRSEKLRELYHELFYNVSYFNLIAVISIIVAAILLLPTPSVPDFARGWPPIEAYLHWLNTSTASKIISTISRDLAMFAFYALAIEVVFSIGRVIGRTSFYFERKMGKVRGAGGIDP